MASCRNSIPKELLGYDSLEPFGLLVAQQPKLPFSKNETSAQRCYAPCAFLESSFFYRLAEGCSPSLPVFYLYPLFRMAPLFQVLRLTLFSHWVFGTQPVELRYRRKIKFTHGVLDSFERKVQYMKSHARDCSNVEVTTL